ncbi:hypothetical protein D0C36_13610 [Mucilaginibacter conchicola]|uniref:Uncharacterized protein n=1 Tax=Mucilaginibacter conchicola TaxID=2303333 RepID=A0A372NUV3_9SPHI|nr:hypothetical protein [Mucilaginibacter conchicola]RFZ92459.1 hypothetical protein D0C36_13610 [Mucilaginibacter conchicola]
MMKRTGILLLVLLYTVTASGFSLNLHYCGNRVADIKLNTPAQSCIKPMAKSKMKCCKDSKIDVKVKDSHEQQQAAGLPKMPPAADMPRLSFTDFFLPVQQAIMDKLFNRGPPDKPQPTADVLIKNCTLKI